MGGGGERKAKTETTLWFLLRTGGWWEIWKFDIEIGGVHMCVTGMLSQRYYEVCLVFLWLASQTTSSLCSDTDMCCIFRPFQL